MAKCSDEGQCYCKIHGGGIIEVDGTGTMTDPYVISTGPVGNFMTVADTPTVDLTLTGSGTGSSPYNLTANAQVSLDELTDVLALPGKVGQVLAQQADGTYALVPQTSIPVGSITTGCGIAGDGSAGNPISVNLRTQAEWNTLLPGINISTAVSAFYCRTADNRIVQVPQPLVCTYAQYMAFDHTTLPIGFQVFDTTHQRLRMLFTNSGAEVEAWRTTKDLNGGVWGWNWGNEYYNWYVPSGNWNQPPGAIYTIPVKKGATYLCRSDWTMFCACGGLYIFRVMLRAVGSTHGLYTIPGIATDGYRTLENNQNISHPDSHMMSIEAPIAVVEDENLTVSTHFAANNTSCTNINGGAFSPPRTLITRVSD